MYSHNYSYHILYTKFSEIFHSEVDDAASLICLECKSSSKADHQATSELFLVFIRSLGEGGKVIRRW